MSSDHDPLFRFHRWLANLRILEVEEIKSIPYVPVSHPFVERLIGTIRREFLDHVLIWNEIDLQRKLEEFRIYYECSRMALGSERTRANPDTQRLTATRRWIAASQSSEEPDCCWQFKEKDMADNTVAAFKGSFPEFYDRYLVPMNFAPYARMLAGRAKDIIPIRVLETAAGTGIVTEELVRILPPDVTITATDLNQPMIDHALAKPGMVGVTWRQADAIKLPFPDGSFDLIVCQFGVMFFPDKQAAFREALRVLWHGGTFLFAVWDSYRAMINSPVVIAAGVVGELLEREPFSLLAPPYHDEDTIRADLAAAGFGAVQVERNSQPSNAASSRDAAVITVQGSMIRSAIEATNPHRLDEATDAVERVMLARFGPGPIKGSTNALIVTAKKFSA